MTPFDDGLPMDGEALAAARVLVVDDDPAARLLCRRMLREIVPEGVGVDEAADAEQALRLLRERPYDAILADQRLGWISGIDLLEITLREQPACLRLLMTGHAGLEMVKEALDRARIDGFLRKQASVAQTREELRALLCGRG